MLTLKEHWEKYLTNKSQSQITMHILSIKKEMNRLKRKIEQENIANFKTLPQKEGAQIRKLRLYLRDSYAALEDIGGKYQFSASEKFAINFQNNIASIQKIEYSIGGYFSGYESYEVESDGERINILFEPSHGNDSIEMPTEEANSRDKNEFLKSVESLQMGEWRSEYKAKDYGFRIMDGISWEIQITYSNNLDRIEFRGDNVFPYNFSDFHKLVTNQNKLE